MSRPSSPWERRGGVRTPGGSTTPSRSSPSVMKTAAQHQHVVPDVDEEELPLFPTSNGKRTSVPERRLIGDSPNSKVPIHARTNFHGTGSSSGGGSKSDHVDPSRAPKLAALLVVVFFLCAALVNVMDPTGMEGFDSTQDKDSTLADTDGSIGSSLSTSRTTSTASLKVKLPKVELTSPSLQHFADMADPIRPNNVDVPVFWHVPRAGGSTVKDITAICLHLVQASEVGVFGGHGADETLQVVQDVEGAKFVNVDTVTSVTGIDRAAQLGLASSGLVDVVVTPFLHNAGQLFDENHRGRMFAMLRHPVERAVSMYYFMRSTPHGRDFLDGMTLEDYATSDKVENNWMTRFLSNKLDGELTPSDEALAGEVLRRKCLIGLLSRKGESMQRFQSFFGWNVHGEKMAQCHEKYLYWNWSGKHKHPTVREDSDVYEALAKQNTFDVRLYAYAEELFEMQEVFFRGADDSGGESEEEEEEEEESEEMEVGSSTGLRRFR